MQHPNGDAIVAAFRPAIDAALALFRANADRLPYVIVHPSLIADAVALRDADPDGFPYGDPYLAALADAGVHPVADDGPGPDA